MASILRPLGIPFEVTNSIDPDEIGSTFEENALIKASAYGSYIGDQISSTLEYSKEDALKYLKMANVWTISEDSGLCVSAINNLPGHYSARFDDCVLEGNRVKAHKKSDRSRDVIDHDNYVRVLQMMKDIEQPYRGAKFVISLMVADVQGKILFKTVSETHGWIAETPRGSNGFGYDPIFISGASFGKTWAEIDTMRKNLISHRRKALREFTSWIAAQMRNTI
jgi:XTP/dITP diphosphohydrolase